MIAGLLPALAVSTVAATAPADAADLVDRALTAAGHDLDEYERLREDYLAGGIALTPGADDHWKRRVVLEAWNRCREEPGVCRRLRDYVPPGNSYRNPFPRMRRHVQSTFASAGATGSLTARELIAVHRQTWYGGLSLLLGETRPELTFEVLLDHLKDHDDGLAARVLLEFPDRAAEIHAALPAAAAGRGRIVWLLGELEHHPALDDLGAMLMALEKDQRNDWFEFDYYGEGRFGITVVRAMESITGRPLCGSTGSAQDDAECIDAAKRWWAESQAARPAQTAPSR